MCVLLFKLRCIHHLGSICRMRFSTWISRFYVLLLCWDVVFLKPNLAQKGGWAIGKKNSQTCSAMHIILAFFASCERIIITYIFWVLLFLIRWFVCTTLQVTVHTWPRLNMPHKILNLYLTFLCSVSLLNCNFCKAKFSTKRWLGYWKEEKSNVLRDAYNYVFLHCTNAS